MLKQLSVFWRLLAAFGLVALLGAAIGAVGISSTTRMNERAQLTYDQDLTGLKLSARAESAVVYANRALALAMLATDDEARSDLIAQAQRFHEEAKESLALARAQFGSEQGADLHALALTIFGRYDAAFNELVAGLRRAPAGGRDAVAQALFGPYAELVEPLTKTLHAMIEWKVSSAKDNADTTGTIYRASSAIVAGLTALAIAAALALGTLIARSIAAPLDRVVRVAGAVASGDLSTRVESGGPDEIARLQRALRDMLATMTHSIRVIQESSSRVSGATRRIAAGSSELAARTRDSVSAIESFSAGMSDIQRNSESDATAMGAAVDEIAVLLDAVQANETAIRGLLARMSALERQSREIAEIVQLIDGISFQTNILALNASVEAARAGVHGRGFAVVAQEVQALAQRSAGAAKQISAIVSSSTLEIDASNALANEAGKAVAQTVERAQAVNRQMTEVRDRAGHNARLIRRFQSSVGEFTQATQSNALLVDSLSQTTSDMDHSSEGLATLLGRFKLAA